MLGINIFGLDKNDTMNLCDKPILCYTRHGKTTSYWKRTGPHATDLYSLKWHNWFIQWFYDIFGIEYGFLYPWYEHMHVILITYNNTDVVLNDNADLESESAKII